MKREIGKLFIIFGALICIFALVGCDLILGNNPDTEENSAEESSSETFKSGEETSEELSEETKENIVFKGTIQNNESDVVLELIEYLRYYKVGVFPHILPYTFEDKFDEIKSGTQPLLVDFDHTSSYYFICGYCLNKETTIYRDAGEYTWIRYENENEIQEYYNGEQIVIAFQINAAIFIDDILPSDKEVPKVEHFQVYECQFVDGFNVSAPVEFYETFIYLNSSTKSTVYYCTDKYNSYRYDVPCIYYKDQYCLTIYMGYKYSDGSPEHRENHESVYGKYSKPILESLIETEGVAYIGNGRVYFYGLLPIEDFANKILK